MDRLEAASALVLAGWLDPDTLPARVDEVLDDGMAGAALELLAGALGAIVGRLEASRVAHEAAEILSEGVAECRFEPGP